MSKSTRATLAPNKLGVNFTLRSYDHDGDAERIGLQAAQAIGIEPRRLLKTLMADVGRSAAGRAFASHARGRSFVPPPPTIR
jgi:prolyl-tRNA editing enzyme YbaK/EbsC (Cys-tRNA(Pro) deacylase)